MIFFVKLHIVHTQENLFFLILAWKCPAWKYRCWTLLDSELISNTNTNSMQIINIKCCLYKKHSVHRVLSSSYWVYASCQNRRKSYTLKRWKKHLAMNSYCQESRGLESISEYLQWKNNLSFLNHRKPQQIMDILLAYDGINVTLLKNDDSTNLTVLLSDNGMWRINFVLRGQQ